MNNNIINSKEFHAVLDEKAKGIEETPKSRLFRYRSGGYDEFGKCNTIEALNNDEIWLSLASEMDDPFDCKFKPKEYEVIPLVTQRLVDITNSSQDNLNTDVIKMVSDYIIKDYNTQDKYYLACFSENDKSSIMWHYYANKHNGFCIEYDYSDIKLGILNKIFEFAKDEEEQIFFFPVVYTRNRNIDGLISQEELLIKNDEWSFEAEWRIIYSTKLFKEKKYLPIKFENITPKSIIAGYKVEKNGRLMEDLEKYCTKRNIDLKQIELNENEFGFVE